MHREGHSTRYGKVDRLRISGVAAVGLSVSKDPIFLHIRECIRDNSLIIANTIANNAYKLPPKVYVYKIIRETDIVSLRLEESHCCLWPKAGW